MKTSVILHGLHNEFTLDQMKACIELAEKYGDKIKFCSLNITSARRVAIKQQVLGLPTMLMYKDGQKIDEINKDDANLENIEAMIQKHYN